ncbi:MAG: hypothetical protein J6Y92_09965 [Lentisphaeria bacterium]|nr:hypothetical protein [Lentisphaeria bacterium]
MPDEETKPAKPELKLDATTVLAIAQALQHVRDLEELDSGRMTVAGAGTLSLRSGLAVLRRILTLPRMIVLADKAAENPAWWRANRLAYYTTMKTKEIARWCGCSEKSVRKYISEPEIGEDAYEALPPENPFD